VIYENQTIQGRSFSKECDKILKLRNFVLIKGQRCLGGLFKQGGQLAVGLAFEQPGSRRTDNNDNAKRKEHESDYKLNDKPPRGFGSDHRVP